MEARGGIPSLASPEVCQGAAAPGRSHQALFISPKTVEPHKYHIMAKLDVDTVTDMTKLAIRQKLIKA